MAVTLYSESIFHNSFTDILHYFCSRAIIKDPCTPCTRRYTTLRLQTNVMINAELQGSVATCTYFRYGAVVKNRIKKGLLLSISVRKI